MQTAFHIRALVRQLKTEAVGGTVISTAFYKKERAAWLFIKCHSSSLALGIVYHPAGHGTMLIPASKVSHNSREKPWPIFKLEGAVVVGVTQFGFDRIFKLHLEIDGTSKQLVVEALGPNGNLWLLDENQQRSATLRKRQFDSGEKYQPSPLPDRLDPLQLTSDRLQELIARYPHQPIEQILEKQLQGCNRSLAREIATRSNLKQAMPNDIDRAGLSDLVTTVAQITDLFDNGTTGYLYDLPTGFEAYPFKLSSLAAQPQKFKSLSLAVASLVSRRREVTEVRDERKIVNNSVKRAISKMAKRLENLDSDLKQAADFETFKKYGELLQINASKITKGMTEAVVNDIYIDSQPELTIKLDPALSVSDNAKTYFKKYRKGREGLALLQRRAEVSRQQYVQWQEILRALDDNFDNAAGRFEQELASLVPRGSSGSTVAPRLPYKEHLLTTGVTIFVGRDGSDNDRTTFEFARPYELWFHTQQCPGSHVVIKYPNKSFEPSKQEIEETASVAAWFSKARRNRLVPVIYTQRKYIRKPRKAKPGLVTVEREKSIMVEPKSPDK